MRTHKLLSAFLLVASLLISLDARAQFTGAYPVGPGVKYTCQTSAPAPVNSDRDWVRCSDRHKMHTNSSNADSDLTAATNATGVIAGSYTNTNLTVGADGRITSAANGTAGGGGGYATIQQNALALTQRSVVNFLPRFNCADDGANTRTNCDLSTSGVSAATYGDATHVPQLTIDAYGRITNAVSIAITTLPDQSGNNGKYLTTNGTIASWATVNGMAIGTAVTGGTNKSVLIVDNSGNLGQDNANFSYDPSAHILTANGGQVATLNDVDGLDIKQAVIAMSTSNVASLLGTLTMDGIVLIAGKRVLLTGQSTGSQNGIWIVQIGAWTRPADFPTGGHAAGSFVFVEQGTLYQKTGWVCTAIDGSDTIDTNSLTYAQFSGAGTYTAGNGLSLSGSQFTIDTAITVDKTTTQTLDSKTFTSTRTADAAVAVNLLTKAATTAGRFIVVTTSDLSADGVSSSSAAGSGNTFKQWEVKGQIVTITSDGVSAISPGDYLSISTTTAGDITKGTGSIVCKATSSIAASAGATGTCVWQ